MPLVRDNGLPSGLAEGVVPAVAISLILLATGYGIASKPRECHERAHGD